MRESPTCFPQLKLTSSGPVTGPAHPQAFQSSWSPQPGRLVPRRQQRPRLRGAESGRSAAGAAQGRAGRQGPGERGAAVPEPCEHGEAAAALSPARTCALT